MDSITVGSRPFSNSRTAMLADATRVALPTAHPHESRVPGVGIKQLDLPPHRETYIGPADPHSASRHDVEAGERYEANIDGVCSLDPFAAEVNGMRNFGTQAQPHWQRIGPSPLEYAASMAQPPVFGVINAAKGVAEAVHDPSAVNVATAALGSGSLLLGSMTRVSGLPHGLHRVAEGAERVHQGLEFAETGGTVENLKKALGGEHAEAHK